MVNVVKILSIQKNFTPPLLVYVYVLYIDSVHVI